MFSCTLPIPRSSDGSVVLLHLTTFPVANLRMMASDENFKLGQMNTATDKAADRHAECQIIYPDGFVPKKINQEIH